MREQNQSDVSEATIKEIIGAYLDAKNPEYFRRLVTEIINQSADAAARVEPATARILWAVSEEATRFSINIDGRRIIWLDKRLDNLDCSGIAKRTLENVCAAHNASLSAAATKEEIS